MAKEIKSSEFWKNIWNVIKDLWAIVFAFGSAIVSAYEYTNQWLSQGYIKPNFALFVWLTLFLIFGTIAIIKAKIEQRKAQKELQEFKKEFNKFKSEQVSINSQKQRGGQLVAVGTSNAPINMFLGETKTEVEK